MTDQERRLRYFQKFQQEILQRLEITQPPETLTDEDRVGLASAYLEALATEARISVSGLIESRLGGSAAQLLHR